MYPEKFLIVILFLLPISLASASSVAVISPSQWASNSTFHWIQTDTGNFKISTNVNLAGFSWFTMQPQQYFQNDSIYKYANTTSSTEFFTSHIAYPQSFTQAMVNDNFSGCRQSANIPQSSSNITTFFYDMCDLYNLGYYPSNISSIISNTIKTFNQSNSTQVSEESNAINQSLKSVIDSGIPDDLFSNDLYNISGMYSQACANGNSFGGVGAIVYLDCQGNPSNDIILPYYQTYYKYYMSLLLESDLEGYDNFSIPYDELLYSIDGKNIFPVKDTSQVFQPSLSILGLYPGILPSSSNAKTLLNNATIGLPVNYAGSNDISLIESNGTFIGSGVYNNIDMFTGIQDSIVNYSIYRIPLDQPPFKGSLNTASIEYANSCGGSIGLSAAENTESLQVQQAASSSLIQSNLIPSNYQSLSGFPGILSAEIKGTGISITNATSENVIIGNTILTYGASYGNGSVAYSNSVSDHPSGGSTYLLDLKIPTNQIRDISSVSQLYSDGKTPYSYSMAFSGFSENIFNDYHQTSASYTYNIGNVTVTCYTHSVSDSGTYNATPYSLGTTIYSGNITSSSTLNVSTNLTVGNIFKKTASGIPSVLNYTFIYNATPYAGAYAGKDILAVPAGTYVDLYYENGTQIYGWSAQNFSQQYASNHYVAGGSALSGKNIYAFDPAYVYPDILSNLSIYYPTITNVQNNGELLAVQESGIQSNIFSSLGNDISGFLSGIYDWATGTSQPSTGNSGNINNQITSINLIDAAKYSFNCPTMVGNYCIIPMQLFYYGSNANIIAPDYDLLNPTLYTQNYPYSFNMNQSKLCSEAQQLAIENNVKFSPPQPCATYSGNYVSYTNDVMNINETWQGFNSSDIARVYNITHTFGTTGNSVLGDSYSIIDPSTFSSSIVCTNWLAPGCTPQQFLLPSYCSNNDLTEQQGIICANDAAEIGNAKYNNPDLFVVLNQTVNPVILKECIYTFCFTKSLTPTKYIVSLDYKMVQESSSLFNFTLVPSTYSSMIPDNMITNISITYNGITSGLFPVGKQFYINMSFNGNESVPRFSQKGNSITIATQFSDTGIFGELPAIVSINPSKFMLPNNSTFYVISQNVKLNFNSLTNDDLIWIAIILIIIMILDNFGIWHRMKMGIIYGYDDIKKQLFD